MTCKACAAALVDPETGHFGALCLECQARSLAQAPAYFEAMAAATFTRTYRQALQVVFGAAWMQGHEAVLAWGRRIEAARKERQRRAALERAGVGA